MFQKPEERACETKKKSVCSHKMFSWMDLWAVGGITAASVLVRWREHKDEGTMGRYSKKWRGIIFGETRSVMTTVNLILSLSQQGGPDSAGSLNRWFNPQIKEVNGGFFPSGAVRPGSGPGHARRPSQHFTISVRTFITLR